MSPPNKTTLQTAELILLCFPGDWSWWKGCLSALFLVLFIFALFSNFTLLLIIWKEKRLHTPMYYFICILSFLNCLLCVVIVPSVLNSLWFGTTSVSAATCFMLMYLMPSLHSIQSAMFMVMAHDHYLAICKPLHYPSITSNWYVLKSVAVAFSKGSFWCVPATVLTAQLDYCSRNVIHQCYFEPLYVSSLACDGNTIVGIDVSVIILFTVGFDMAYITFSYCMIIRAELQLRSRSAMAKTISTFASHFIVISCFYSTIILLVIANAIGDSITVDVKVLLLLCLIPPVLNPLIYGLRTKEIVERIYFIIRSLNLIHKQ